MRRYAFYFGVALLAFLIGLFVAVQFHSQSKDIVSNINEPLEPPINDAEQISQETKGQQPKYTCNDKDILNLRSQLQTDEFLKRYEKDEFLRRKNVVELDCSEIYEAKKVDLNSDGVREIVIRGNSCDICHGRGNCDLWIFQKTRNDYRMILHDEWTFDYKIQTKKTNGYKNLLINLNSSNGNPVGYFLILKFNGKNYQKKECFSEEWIGKTKKTELVRFNCKEDGE